VSKIHDFFWAVGHDFKVIGKDVKLVIDKIFGANFLPQLEATAETILKSDLGKAVLADAMGLMAEVSRGHISQATAIAQLAPQVEQEAKNTGVQLESVVSTMVASAAIARLSGLVGTPAAPPAPPVPFTPPAPPATGDPHTALNG
jgi:hypothetical protein